MTVEQQVARRRSRRDEILEIAVGLFAARGYHGVSMDDIGAAAGVTGPALYHHFAGKEAMLAAALIPVSEQLLAGGRSRGGARRRGRGAARGSAPRACPPAVLPGPRGPGPGGSAWQGRPGVGPLPRPGGGAGAPGGPRPAPVGGTLGGAPPGTRVT